MQRQRREEEHLFERRRPPEEHLFERRRPPEQPPPQPQRMRSASPFGGGGVGIVGEEEFENPIMVQAKTMLARVMACRTPDDPRTAEIVRGEKHLATSMT